MYFPFAKDEAGQKAPYKIEKMKYYLIAGEPSGDLHGANLIKGLKAHDPEAKFRFWGGDCMAAAGGAENQRKHYRETSFFGIVQVLKNLGTIRRQMRECQADVAEFAPDVLILVDYPGFNMKMARWAKEHGIRTFYYIAPKVWAWREWRVKAIRRYVDRLFIIFPFERTYFPKHGITPVFEGNPLVDAIEARRTTLPRQPAADGRAVAKIPRAPVRGGGRRMARPGALRTIHSRKRHPLRLRPDLRNARRGRSRRGDLRYGDARNGAARHSRSGGLQNVMVSG